MPYPNPFNPEVNISYGLAKAEYIEIGIYNNKGQKIRTLVNADKNPGNDRLTWDGTNDNGKPLGSGIYYIKMVTGKYHSTQKTVLMK